MALLAGGAMFAAPRVAIGVSIGSPAPRAYASAYVAQPPCPGPGYAWVDGYWSQNGGRRSWVAGYWQAPRIEQRFNDRDNDRNRRDHDRGRDSYREQDRSNDRGRSSFGNGFRR